MSRHDDTTHARPEHLRNLESESISSSEDVTRVLAIEDSVGENLRNLDLDQNGIAQQTPEDQQKTKAAFQGKAFEATVAALTQVGVQPEQLGLPIGSDASTEPQQRQEKVAALARRRVIGFLGALTEKIFDRSNSELTGSENDDQIETEVETQFQELEQNSKVFDVIKMSSLVSEYVRKLLPNKKKESEDTFRKEYKSIMVDLAKRLGYVKKRLKYLTGTGVESELKIAMSFTTLIPFALVGELRRNFDLAHKTLWWLKRTSRIYIEDRHGGIGEREPQDQSLRNESSSFPLAAEIPQTDVGSILTKKLERYAQNQKEYFINDGIANVLVWNKNTPQYIHVPLEWFSQNPPIPLGEIKQRIDALLKQVVENTAAPGLTDVTTAWLRQKAFGNYSDQGREMQQVFDADISIVLDPVDVNDPQAVMNHNTFLTAGARVRETLIFQHTAGSTDPLGEVNGIVNKFAHTYVDGKKARAVLFQDLEGTDALSKAEAPEPATFDRTGLVTTLSQEFAGEISKNAQKKFAVDRNAGNGEQIGVARVNRDRSEAWIRKIGSLREWFKKADPNNPVSFGTADLFCLAQMLSSRTETVHYLESREAKLPVKLEDGSEGVKDTEVLDVAFNIIPKEYLDVFTKLMSEVQRDPNVDPQVLVQEAWKRLPYTPEQINNLRLHFLEGLRQFNEEKKRAKESNSMASFMSTLAGGIKQVEKLMQFVSASGVLVGEKITQAVGNPRGGMVSMLAETRSLPQRQDNGINMLWFASANTDTFMGDTTENWGGVLGVSSSSEGFSFVLRKVNKQCQVSPDYYAKNKAFQESKVFFKNPVINAMSLYDLPFVIDSYELSTPLEKKAFFGQGNNHELIIGFLKKQAAALMPTSEAATISQDTQHQAEDVVYAMEFMLQLLSSDPALQAARAA